MKTKRSMLWAKAAAASALLASGTGAQADTSVTLHGLVDAYVGSVKYSGMSGRENSVGNGGLTTSWFGLSGEEQLKADLSAVFDLESFFRVNTGEVSRARPGDTFFSRQASVGLKGNWGTIRLGRNTAPNFFPSLFFNPLGASFNFSPLFLHSYSPTIDRGVKWANSINGDTGWSNSVSYQTPRMAGLTANLVYQFGSAEHSRSNVGANIIYRNGPFAATVFGQKVKLNNPSGMPFTGVYREETSWFGGLSYDFDFVKLFATYQQAKHDTALQDKTWQLGASAPLGKGKVMISWANTRRDTGTDTLKRNTATAGYDYFISKRTDVYLLGMYDKVTGMDEGTSVVAGIRHRF
ncbi:porin [Pusillimonas caeni]|uniref:porin n=1 Tax=Pusillimonas caeni TaxID=1348472 RepID=UPI000E59C20C|nr:porin [Pusillimonas caeni]TFL10104.1 porin [Pusillimonas caeni]